MRLFIRSLEQRTKKLKRQLEDFHTMTFVPEPFEMNIGSDYSHTMLCSSLESLIRKNCKICEGTGKRMIQNGADDYFIEECEYCS